MFARAVGRLSLLVSLAFVAAASRGVAQAGVELSYEAFEGCPEREAFAKNLEGRRRGAAMPSGAVRLDVRLSRADARVEGSIVVSHASGAPSARRIVAATCSEAADALALIAALALQGIEVEEVPADDKSDRRTDRSRESEGRARERPTEPAATTETTTETTSEPESEPEPEPEPAIELAGRDAQAGAEPEEAAHEERTEDDAIEPSADSSSRAYVLLSGGVASGVLPAVQPLPELALSWEHATRAFPIWSVQAAFRISPEQTRHFDQGVVTVSWWTGLSALCLGARGSQLSASGCASLEVGALSGGATETDNPREKQRAWVALGPGASLAYDITQALRLQLRAELLTPLARYRLELPRGTAVHEPSALGLRVALGAGLRL